jgi:hypothetical protein
MTPREAILNIVNDRVKFLGKMRLATVVSVSWPTCMVSTLDSETELEVRLNASGEAGNALQYLPKVGSIVGIMNLFDFEYTVVMYSEVDSIQFLDGSYGGLIKIQDLVSKINAIEQKVNDINTALKAHTHTGVTAGSGVSGPSTAFASISDLTETVVSDIENDKITHGNI